LDVISSFFVKIGLDNSEYINCWYDSSANTSSKVGKEKRDIGFDIKEG
jgi:hypothetical protein